MTTSRRISVFGLGYLGSVSAACLARLGHEVVGVDVDRSKVEALDCGASPVLEPGLDALVAEQHRAGRIRATMDAVDAVARTDTSLVCVGTPSAGNGSLDMTFVHRVCQQIGTAIAKKLAGPGGYHLVVIRSTVLPGALEREVIVALEWGCGRRAGQEFGVVHNPEFLREGSAVEDFLHPSRTVIGADSEKAAALAADLYRGIDAPLFVTSLGVASVVKYADNTFHAVKITFGNEIGLFCKKLGIDSHEVMRIFCEDRKLNISPAYLRPAFAFGGSCLPKDIRALQYRARTLDLDLALLSSLLESNRYQTQALIDQLMPYRREGIGVLGVCFKPGTDDLRESPMVTVIKTLLGRGAEVRIHDPSLRLSALVGSNLQYVMTEIPHIGNLLKESAEAVIRPSKAIVVAHRTPLFREALARTRPQQLVFDLVRLADIESIPAGYVGLYWDRERLAGTAEAAEVSVVEGGSGPAPARS